MENQYSVQNLEYAVSVFYNSEQNERAQAHQWLTTAQRCPEAWSFVWELLQPTKPTEVQFFAATTLHTKLLRCWGEVPEESHEELKNKILHAVLSYAKGPKIVLNRLCISLAAFILQQASTDLVAILNPLSSVENRPLLLEVLTVIPEEFNSMTMLSPLRVKNRIILQKACPAVLDDMLQCFQGVYSKEPPSEETIQWWWLAALCCGSWLALGADEATPERGTSVDLALRLPLVNALLSVVQQLYTHHEVISDSALEACEAALNAVRAAGTAPDAARCPAAALQLLTELAALAGPILARDNVPNSINEELLSAIATCAVSLTECHSRAIVIAIEREEHAGAIQTLELLLASQAAPGHYPLHETRSHLVTAVWYTVQDEILCVSAEGSAPRAVWRSLFSRLLRVLVHKCEAPADDALSRDDAELLRCYRQDLADTVMYCYGVLGDYSFTLLEAAWRAASTDGAREACLHVLHALGDTAPQRRAPPHLALMLEHAVLAAAAEDKQLCNTALHCLGAYSWWLSSMEDKGPILAMSALRAAGAALDKAPQAAALALKKLSTECSGIAAPLAGEIVQAAQSGRGGGDAWVRRQLLGAAGAALSAAERPLSAPLLRALADSIHIELVRQAAEPSKSHGGAEAAAALMTSLKTRSDLAADLFTTLLPALPPFSHHAALVPPLFLILNQTISVLMDDCLPMMDHIARLAVQANETHQCASGIDVAKLVRLFNSFNKLVLMFGNQWEGCPTVLHATVSAAARACAADAAGRSDVTEALFIALQSITKKKPRYIDSLVDLLPQLVDLGCNCIRLWEAGAARAACGWLSALAAVRPAALAPRAPDLTAAALRCIGGATPRNQVEPLAELLLALNRASFSDGGLAAWLRGALHQDNFPTPHATDHHKLAFINNVLKEKSSKRRLLETVQEFSLVCRGLIGTEYARQTLAAKQLIA